MSSTTAQQQQTIADQALDWSQNLGFAQFNPSLGTLDSIGVGLTGDVLGTISVESLEAAPSTVSVSLDDVVGVTSPADVPMAGVAPEAFASASLAAYADTVLSGLSATATTQSLFQPGSIDLGDFIGSGSVPLTVAAISQLDVTGPANLQIASQASAGATVTLQYDYSTPNSESGGGGGGSDLNLAVDYNYVPGLPSGSVTTAAQTVSFADQTTGWTNNVPVQQFNPSLGSLEAVNITLSGDIAASVAAENENATASTVFTTQTATLDLDLPNGDIVATAAPTVGDSMALGGYDGTADYAGTSGRIDQGLTHTASDSAMLNDPADLALFTGTGTVAAALSAVGTSTLDGPGNLLARLLAQAGATVSVSYTYLPWTQVTWTNAAGGDWAAGANWSSSPVSPEADDALAITQAGTYTITLSSTQTAESVLLDAPGAVLVLDAPLSVAAGFTLEAGTLEFNGGSLSVGSFEQDGGLATGAVDIVSSGDIALNAGTIVGTGVTLTAGTSIDVSGAATVTAAGTVDVAAGLAVGAGGQSTTLAVEADSLLTFGSVTTVPVTTAGPVTTSGTIVLAGLSGTLETTGVLGDPLAITGSISGSPGFAAFDTTTDQAAPSTAQPYTGPVSGLQNEYISVSTDSLNLSFSTPNWFIHSGSGNDAIAVSSGTNVLDGGTGSNFLTGGSGTDTFFVDDRGPTADIWSTVNNFHAGDAATIWGVTPQDFEFSWVDGQGAVGYTGLTLHATAPGLPTASLTLVGFTSADLSNGKLTVSYGTVGGSSYMYVYANS